MLQTENLHKRCWKLKNVIRLACKKVAENSPTMHFLVSTLHPATLQYCNTAMLYCNTVILSIILKMLQCYTEDGDAKHTENSKLWPNQLLRACATVLAVLHWIYIFVFVFTTACIIFSVYQLFVVGATWGQTFLPWEQKDKMWGIDTQKHISGVPCGRDCIWHLYVYCVLCMVYW